jgi:hypothetical protein
MSEWWTYSLSDFLLFSPRTYYRLFELYNADVWPGHLLAIALGLVILVAWHRGWVRIIPAILGALWLWVAWAYLLIRYDTINWAARYLAIGFALQALLLIVTGLVRDRFRLRSPADVFGGAGLALFLFALVAQPLIGPLLGRPWTQTELFGLAPDPTVAATLGVLVAAARPHWELVVIPLLGCAISAATLWTMQSPDWVVMAGAAVVAGVLTAWKSVHPEPAWSGMRERPIPDFAAHHPGYGRANGCPSWRRSRAMPRSARCCRAGAALPRPG